ncbi:TPA: GIY-YIG nuclease family protein [Pseudomonas aeruginosa]|uniref:GIY-YIG nuclease family protein n=1 Tax=Pseudomonas aeruginosa TaxID=287 RepID=UPI0039821A52|nr:GIY-YIG nuclease family protein [Pseudomonas aeruginosa]HBP1309430.1 GIY-YIG nuclease family protein [Pseudomonas aeruginosa]HCF6352952.1 GIY-YIG nuclease family protein [Pseudomonas aeruginosa]
MEYFKDLEFDLPSALLAQLVDLFERMTPGPLNEETVLEVPEEQGVYQLFFNGELVYVGKTDADAGLRQRLLRHAKKIRSRRNLHQSQVTFKAVRVYVFTAMDLEDLLIKHYRGAGVSLAWNLSGFGSNDPGRNRDKSVVKENHFDSLYPIDLDFEARVVQSEDDRSVAEVLRQLKDQLAYTVRYQNAGGRSKQPHIDLVEAQVSLRSEEGSVLNVLRQVKVALGEEWQITALPGYVIIYKENEHYPHGEVIEVE